jgi:hypothetical protein
MIDPGHAPFGSSRMSSSSAGLADHSRHIQRRFWGCLPPPTQGRRALSIAAGLSFVNYSCWRPSISKTGGIDSLSSDQVTCGFSCLWTPTRHDSRPHRKISSRLAAAAGGQITFAKVFARLPRAPQRPPGQSTGSPQSCHSQAEYPPRASGAALADFCIRKVHLWVRAISAALPPLPPRDGVT